MVDANQFAMVKPAPIVHVPVDVPADAKFHGVVSMKPNQLTTLTYPDCADCFALAISLVSDTNQQRWLAMDFDDPENGIHISNMMMEFRTGCSYELASARDTYNVEVIDAAEPQARIAIWASPSTKTSRGLSTIGYTCPQI